MTSQTRRGRWYCPVDAAHGRWDHLDDIAHHMLADHRNLMDVFARWGAEAELRLIAQVPDTQGRYRASQFDLHVIDRFANLVDFRLAQEAQ